MARINIEDSLYRDNRFLKLVVALDGDVDRALGSLIRAWSLAQKYYLKDDGMIPEEVWCDQGIPNQILECKLAKKINNRIKVAGADDQFKWLRQKSEAGRRGAEKTNFYKMEESRRAPAGAGVCRTESGGARPPTLPLTLSLSLKKEEEETTADEKVLKENTNHQEVIKTLARDPLSIYFEQLCIENFSDPGLAMMAPRVVEGLKTIELFNEWVDDVQNKTWNKIKDKRSRKKYFRIALDKFLKERGV